MTEQKKVFIPHLSTANSHSICQIEAHFQSKQDVIEAWFHQAWETQRPPFYGSVDLRHAGYKIAPIDTNCFPAGFNNLSETLMPYYQDALKSTLKEIHPGGANELLIIAENHTRNRFYFESLRRLQAICQGAGYEVFVATMNPEIHDVLDIDLPSGGQLSLYPLVRDGDRVGIEVRQPAEESSEGRRCFPDCLILNNDLSSGVPPILVGIEQLLLPPMSMGWASRLKSEHFFYYQSVAEAFAKTVELDPWLITPWFDQCPEVDFMQKEGVECLVTRASALLKRIEKKYKEYGINDEPFLIVKADQGTYGMAVLTVKDPKELSQLNRKQRTSMSSLKGGAMVTKALIQEGVYTHDRVDGAVAEPVIYTIGRHVLGGFYRSHAERGSDQNLNAPGMRFSSMTPVEGQPGTGNTFYTYAVIARLALLAARNERDAFHESLKGKGAG